MNIYPAIDLMNGRVVRLTKGHFDSVKEYGDNPIEVAVGFAKAGAKFLHLVDLDGARDGQVQQADVLTLLVQSSALEIQVGGGIRSLSQARHYLAAGAKRVVVGSLAVRSPEDTRILLNSVGADRVTLAVDFKRDANEIPRVALHGWKETAEISAVDLIEKYISLGIKHVLCTDVGRDGTLNGPDVELYTQWQLRFPNVEIQVSGGIGTLDHVRALRSSGAPAVIIGKAFYERAFSLEEALKC
jgi:phosphoribosylformimino-5-aminoimidazole carboxamide ribotide isomerase